MGRGCRGDIENEGSHRTWFFFIVSIYQVLQQFTSTSFLDLPLEESWFAFYELQFADVPLGWWILNTTLLLGWGIAIWTGS